MTMNKKNITILTLWDWERIIIEMDIENFIEMQREDLSIGMKEFYISYLKRTICYSDIKWKQWKTNYIALEAPKQEFKESTPEERKARDKMLAEMLEKTYNARKKNFITERNRILFELAKTEKRFDFQTTIEKLEDYNKIKQKYILELK